MGDKFFRITELLSIDSKHNWFENRNSGDISNMSIATLRVEEEYISMTFHSRTGKPLRGGFWLDISSFTNIAIKFLQYLGYEVTKNEQ